jgi:pantoate--beta-alanine ligase
MKVIATVAEIRAAVAEARARQSVIGLVPTMGSFHEGHLSLMRRARSECGQVVVSLFVNPAQFGPNEDFSRYPRDPERDAALARTEDVDFLFTPSVAEIYPPGFVTYVEVERLGERLCGRARPGHFRGVATVVTKLFTIVRPDRAYFGRKDYQQFRIVERLAADLDLGVTIVPMPIVREPDGVALSSRNQYLSPQERTAARALRWALVEAEAAFARGERDPAALQEGVAARIRAEPAARLEYAELVDAETLAAVTVLSRPALLAVAAFFGATRLIDNTVLGESGLP